MAFKSCSNHRDVWKYFRAGVPLGIPFSWYPKGIIPVFAVDLATVFTEFAVTRLGKRRIVVSDSLFKEPQHAQNDDDRVRQHEHVQKSPLLEISFYRHITSQEAEICRPREPKYLKNQAKINMLSVRIGILAWGLVIYSCGISYINLAAVPRRGSAASNACFIFSSCAPDGRTGNKTGLAGVYLRVSAEDIITGTEWNTRFYLVRPVSKRNQIRRSVSSIQVSNRLVVATSFSSAHRS